MRDTNLTLKQFNIQLERNLIKNLDDKFLTRPVFVTPTRLSEEFRKYCDFSIQYPRTFRLMRALCIAQWYFQEDLHWRVLLDLKDKSFSNFTIKQRIELYLLLESKEKMELYLFRTQRYSPGELFGNLLGNDIRDLNKVFKIRIKRKKKPRRKIRRRGYKDKGSRRPSHQWLPDADFSLTEKQIIKERKQYLLQKTINYIFYQMENSVEQDE